jgi:hypothetical protein
MKWYQKWLVEKAEQIVLNTKQRQEVVWQKQAREEKFAVGSALNISNGLSLKSANSISELESNPDLNFRMYRAENGYAMEVRRYDKRTERHGINLHLITDNEDLGQAIAHIITVESLKAN